MKIERGNYKVIRACCTSGNCVACRAAGVKAKRKIVVQMDNLSEAMARKVAKNFASYDAQVVKQ